MVPCSLPGSSVHGIVQARVPECGAIIRLGRAGDWLGNGFAEPTHTASPSEGLLGWDTLLMEGLPASGGIVLGTLRRGVTAPV